MPIHEARSDRASEVARTILTGFDRHYRLFREAAREAKRLFERADWAAMSELARARITMYDRRVQEGVEAVLARFPEIETDESLWPAIKLAYIPLLHDHRQPELAETFFNSVACQVLHRRYYRNEFIFWRPAVATEHLEGEEPAYRSYYPRKGGAGLRATLARIVRDFGFALPFENLQRDLKSVVHALRAKFPRPSRARPSLQIQVLASPFYRNKGAYIVGKAMNGHVELPFAVPVLQNGRRELFLDTLLTGQDELLILFSFARAYFFVDMEVPAAYVSFLRQLMPRKPRAEMYMTVGLHKQGKTVYYRDLHYHLNHSSDNFVTAPGIKGMVMLVFTLPSFLYVFKVIRDHFAPPKEMDRATVQQKYQLVKFHDRVGRLADTLEYSLVALPLERFDPALLEELKSEAASSIEIEGDRIVLKHVYIERRMQPLNLYVEEALQDGDERRLEHALLEYGDAIKDLAGANIFPGDMLLKNFGVTRHERVVFYDYDEISYMTDCNFRRIPLPRSWEDEMSAEPYYSVGPQDVFPEQFGSFLVSDPHAREIFLRRHRDLTTPEFWQAKQAHIRAGEQEDVFPYPESMRFRR
ncbi:MAG: bifunctional isocitrate dehydrogenase kinase/phosphatase [Betaproteobacteria bacterium RIFCSPLOWO2_12_FULL_67_28]|nr:MAG: bifunctional isocitrate dehydrogenase kinase/phosphatase [Betaproteobacteria bacterium RIFCSPLOWO2_02_FULL_68_150]OGA61186.1 MAG: bifunctional isocitrate dehydrogenase kinase/phosphatase [Betaproteobacteria bacterium RIFCSPLOWO2_12_FULL_67_28]